MSLFVTEIFYSIQGESLSSGRPCAFIRLSGCNLRCRYCDTTYAYEQRTQMDMEDIIDKVESYGCPLIEVTGGEPLFQRETPALVRRLLEKNHEVMVETNGSMDIGLIDNRCTRIVDVKCPSSGQAQHTDFENLKKLTGKDQLKFVIGTRADYTYARQILDRIDSNFPADHILFSPVWGEMTPAVLSEWMLTDRLQVRLHLQLHKIIWPEIDRGV